jgi:hypothetical protein
MKRGGVGEERDRDRFVLESENYTYFTINFESSNYIYFRMEGVNHGVNHEELNPIPLIQTYQRYTIYLLVCWHFGKGQRDPL